MPHRAASGRATARAETVSWSVIASAARPTLAAATTTSQGEQTPSECVVWTCRSSTVTTVPSGTERNRRARLYAGFVSSGGWLETVTVPARSQALAARLVSRSAGGLACWTWYCSTRSRMPLTNRLDWAVLYRLASSRASLMATLAGTSGRNSIS